MLFWYKLKVVHLSSGGNWEKYFSLYKKKKTKQHNGNTLLDASIHNVPDA